MVARGLIKCHTPDTDTMSDEATRIGLLSDIHGNAVALKTVLDDMGPVDALVCAGDIVGYGPSPEECLHMVRERDIPTVVGNHDREVVRGMTWESGDEYARRTLSTEEIEWLADLPRELRLFDGRLKVVHDHPDERDRYTEPDDFAPALLGFPNHLRVRRLWRRSVPTSSTKGKQRQLDYNAR